MNRHYKHGFQRAFTNDIYNVEEQLKAYDDHLYVMWNPHTGEHLIMDGMFEHAVMKIPQAGFPELSSRIVEHMRRIHTVNGFSAVHEVEMSDQARERESDRVLSDLAVDFAKESKDAYRNAYDYGITSGKKKYVQVG